MGTDFLFPGGVPYSEVLLYKNCKVLWITKLAVITSEAPSGYKEYPKAEYESQFFEKIFSYMVYLEYHIYNKEFSDYTSWIVINIFAERTAFRGK